MAKEPKKPNKLESHRQTIKAVMPEIEDVVKRHGLSIVNACIHKIYERNKLKRKAADLRKQIEEIEEKM